MFERSWLFEMTCAVASMASLACVFEMPARTVSVTPGQSGFGMPAWSVGDTWKVKYTIELTSETSPPTPPVVKNFIYTYLVLPETQDVAFPGRDVFRIKATCPDGLPNWKLTIDKVQYSLLRVTECDETHDLISSNNPFGFDSWMPFADEFSYWFIHEFPRFPMTEGTRHISPAQAVPIVSSTPQVILAPITETSAKAFDQTVVFSGGPGAVTATITMVRTDPVHNQEHKTTIVWGGGKWWKSASLTLAGQVKVSAVLQAAGAPQIPK